VRRGDTINSVARRWHVTQDEIVAWNDLHSTGLFAGQRLSLTVASSSGSQKKSGRGSHSNHPSTTLARAAATPAH
jgi:LysM repeat protein